MAESFRKLVVRTYAPRRHALLFGFAIASGVAILYGAFEFGRYDAGYRVVAAVRRELAASARIRALQAEIARQDAQLAAAEVARRVDREGYGQVEHNLGDMQSQIARLTQDLAFYRGLVQPDSTVRVKVQQMQIVPGPNPGQYHLKFALMQTGKPAGTVAGYALLSFDGLRQGKAQTYGFAQVSPARQPRLAYSFRYFQNFDEALQFPPGFAPARIGVELHAGKGSGHGYRQAFVWKAGGMSVETVAAGGAPSKGILGVQAKTK